MTQSTEKAWTIEIDDITPSANTYLRQHWTKRSKLKKAWEWYLVEAGMLDIPRLTEPRKRRVYVSRRSPWKIDHANTVTPIDKLILDTLTKNKVIWDDSDDMVDFAVLSLRGTPKRTIIRVMEA